ncbi:MAG TPA: hypothetical protein VFQ61_07885 [Polyangiaceae bacterium]|nr:hypothetical protein [Polyangiaceae bacterium]
MPVAPASIALSPVPVPQPQMAPQAQSASSLARTSGSLAPEAARERVFGADSGTPSSTSSNWSPAHVQSELDGPLSVDEPAFSRRRGVVPFADALWIRVRLARLELPLWSVLAPGFVLVALISAFAASAVSAHAPTRSKNGWEGQPAPSTVVNAQPPTAPESAPSSWAVPPTAPASADAPDLRPEFAGPTPVPSFGLAPGSYGSGDVSRLNATRLKQATDAARSLTAELSRDPGLAQEPKTLEALRRFLDDPETARVVLPAIAELPAPFAADLLYEVWTSSVARTETTELARAFLFSRDVRAKASPALSVALDLKLAESCDQYRAVLTRAVREGDRRSLPLLIRLQRRFGCGPNKRLDCYDCLRKGDDLEQAIKSVRERREVRSFGAR